MLVCVCKRVSDAMIKEAYEQGIQSVEALGMHHGLGQCCGRCVPYTQKMLDAMSPDSAVAAVQMWSPSGAGLSAPIWNPGQ